MDNNCDELIKLSDHLFGKKFQLNSLHQEIADQFYPERADFTASRSLGTDFASNLMTSIPLIIRRDLGNSFAAMLRRDQWFKISTAREELQDQAAKEWLECATGIQYRAMYDRSALFTRATNEGDHDFAAFGQCVISVELNKNRDGLLYRCWHLRDVAWCEDAEGKVNTIHRKWKPTTKDLKQLFGNNIHSAVQTALEKEPYREWNCRHIVMPADCYEGKWRTPYVSIYMDVENNKILEERGLFGKQYVIPRWQTVSGSQYAYSPATVAALPDARLIQAMTLTLLEAGEKAASPPMLAVQEAIRGDVALYAGGITWVDAAYDERMGEVLRPLTQDKSGFPVGLNMRQEIHASLTEAFYLNKLNLPYVEGATAYEISQRVQEYIRQALPIFGPMEADYNGALCDETFELLMRNGAFGPTDDIPEAIRGADVKFKFESPLNAAIEKEKGQWFQEAANLLTIAAQIDPSVTADFDVREAFRDAVEGIGVPIKWMRSEEDAAKLVEQQQSQQNLQQGAEALSTGAGIMQQMGDAGKAIKEADAA